MQQLVRRHPVIVSLVLAGALAGLLVAAGCRTLPREPGYGARLTPFSFLEETDRITFAVDTQATRYREDKPFVPFGVAVANRGVPRLTITRKSFVLVDEQGREYRMATIPEVKRLASLVIYDLKLSSGFLSAFFTRYSSWPRIPAVFFPLQVTEGEYQSRAIVRDRIELHPQSWMFDVIYFPHPEGRLVGSSFRVRFQTVEMHQPIEVRVRVGEKE